MRVISSYVLIIFVLTASLSLISCTSRSMDVEVIPSPTNLAREEGSATLANVSSTTIAMIPTATPMPTPTYTPEITPFLIPDGKLLFEAYDIINGTRYQVIKAQSLKRNDPNIVIEFGRKVDDQQVYLFSANMTWSPDGHRFAFVGTDLRADQVIYLYQDIFIASADGTEIHRLTYSPQYDKQDLSWSPDGESILVALGQNGKSDLYLVSVNGGDILQRLTSSGGVISGAWAPDGKSITFAENRKLFIMDISNKSHQFISNLPDYTVEKISWSPRGDKIALSILGNNIGCGDIFVFDLNTRKIKDITHTDYAERSASWLPDGQHLVFSRGTYRCGEAVGEGIWDIYISDISGDEQLVVPNVGDQASVSWLPTPSLEIGKQYVVTELGANLNLRMEPSLSGKVLEKLPAGEVITVLEGFVDADDYYWWKIRTHDGVEGWVVEMTNWYKLLTE